VLLISFSWSIDQSSQSDAAQQPALDRSLDRRRREERERDRHVDMAGAAVLAERDFGDAADGAGFDLRKPWPATCDRRDEPRTVVRSDRLAGSLMALFGPDNVAAPLRRWFGPRNNQDGRDAPSC
jgi:hypothetical protein